MTNAKKQKKYTEHLVTKLEKLTRGQLVSLAVQKANAPYAEAMVMSYSALVDLLATVDGDVLAPVDTSTDLVTGRGLAK